MRQPSRLATIGQLAARLESAVDMLFPAHDARTLQNARRAITDDGRPRLDRATGLLGRDALVALAAESIRTDPSSTSVADYLADQLQDVGDLIVEGAVTAVDTTSINMDATFNGTNIEVSADVNFAGSGAANTAAHSDHLHTGVYQPIALTATATLDFPSIAAQTCQELTIALTGAVIGQAVALGPDDTLSVGLIANGYVSAAGVITVRACNITNADINPSAHDWRVVAL
jgi:hypothetical protein